MDSSSLQGRKVLVTGARGFIGSHLCHQLCDGGAIVLGLSRNPAPKGRDGFEWHQGDPADTEAMVALLREVRPDFVFHLHGYVSGSRAVTNVLPSLQANLLSTVSLLHAITTLELDNCRLVVANSLEETTAWDAVPCSPYAAAKSAGTAYARMFHALYGTRVVVVRVGMTYGPGQWDCTKLIPYIITSLLKGEAPRLGSGVRTCDWVFVEDVALGLIAAANAAGSEGSVIDLASGNDISVREVALLLTDLMRSRVQPMFGALPDRTIERPWITDLTRTHEVIGWEASTPITDGLARTVAWYRDLYENRDLSIR